MSFNHQSKFGALPNLTVAAEKPQTQEQTCWLNLNEHADVRSIMKATTFVELCELIDYVYICIKSNDGAVKFD